MKLLIPLIAILLMSQNLAPNPGFENLNACPPWAHLGPFPLQDWERTINSVDAFHNCRPYPANSPATYYGFSGTSACLGIYFYLDYNGEEWTRAPLISPLIAGDSIRIRLKWMRAGGLTNIAAGGYVVLGVDTLPVPVYWGQFTYNTLDTSFTLSANADTVKIGGGGSPVYFGPAPAIRRAYYFVDSIEVYRVLPRPFAIEPEEWGAKIPIHRHEWQEVCPLPYYPGRVERCECGERRKFINAKQ